MNAGMGIVGAVVAAGAISTPSPGPYVGHTSQFKAKGAITLRVSGTRVTSKIIDWKAKCTSGKTLERGTRLGSTRIALKHGAWTSSGSYTAKLPYRRGMTGHFTVRSDTGRFVTRTSAKGTFHLTATLYVNGKRIDRCDTGRITWTARHK